MDTPAESRSKAGCPVPVLVERLEPIGMRLLAGAADAEARVVTPVIEDLTEPLPEVAGGLLLLAGATDSASVTYSLLRAEGRGYIGIVAKSRVGNTETVRRAAIESPLAVLTVSDDVRWRELAALLDSALAASSINPDAPTFAAGEELYRIVDAVARSVGGPAVIEDLDRRVVAYSSVPGQLVDPLRSQGILERRVPDLPDNAELYQQVLSAPGIVRFPEAGDELARSAISIRAGGIPLGTLWVIEDGGSPDNHLDIALDTGARFASLHMLRVRMAAELEHLQRARMLYDQLAGNAREDPTAERLGIRGREAHALLAIAPRDPNPMLTAHLTQEVARLCDALRPDALVTSFGRATYVLLTGSSAADEAVRLAGSMLPGLDDRTRGLACVGIAVEDGGRGDLRTLRADADDVLRALLANAAQPRVATTEDVRTSIMLLHVKDEFDRSPRLRQPAICGLLRDDPQRGRVLLDSVEGWLGAHGDVRSAATRMRIHPNTLRYRLRKFADLTGIDLDDPDQCLATWLEIRASRG